LSNKDVLEIGCFEGIHTIGLCNYSRRVYAVDSRIENVRTPPHGYSFRRRL
jgi:tRNA (mo5U34)-methyltransferase